jgi:hypothetical protein
LGGLAPTLTSRVWNRLSRTGIPGRCGPKANLELTPIGRAKS